MAMLILTGAELLQMVDMWIALKQGGEPAAKSDFAGGIAALNFSEDRGAHQLVAEAALNRIQAESFSAPGFADGPRPAGVYMKARPDPGEFAKIPQE
jgi:hypothetical protein